MGITAVLQIGDAIAGATVPSVDVGNSLACTLTLYDSVTLLAVAADPGSVVVRLTAPDASVGTLSVSSPATGIYAAIPTFLFVGTYTVRATGTASGGTFSFSASGDVACDVPAVSPFGPPVPTVAELVAVTNFPTTQPVSAASLPLPTGAALDATLTGGAAKVQVTNFPAGGPVTGTVAVSNFPATQPVSAASLPLPAGAALDATISARLSPLGQKLSASSASVVLASDQSSVPVTVGNFPSTQPISAAALPLPAGAALDATLTARLGTLGQKTMAASSPVTLASDQPTVPVSVQNFPAMELSGTVSVSNFPSTQPVSAASLPLPTGAALDASITARLGTVGQKAMAASTPVAIASDQSAVPVAVSNFPATQPVSIAASVAVTAASLPLPAGAALDASITARLGTLGQKTSANSSPVVLASDQSAVAVSGSVSVTNLPATQAISAAALPLPAGAAQDATLTGGTQKSIARGGAKGTTTAADVTSAVVDANTQALHTSVTNFPATQAVSVAASVAVTATQLPSALGAAVSASSLAVVLASDQAAIPVTATPTKSATGTQTSVASSATNVTILASNTARKGATVYNDSTAVLYLKLGVTASTTSFTLPLQSSQYYEIPFNYTGEIDGLWASATGNARVTEFT